MSYHDNHTFKGFWLENDTCQKLDKAILSVYKKTQRRVPITDIVMPGIEAFIKKNT